MIQIPKTSCQEIISIMNQSLSHIWMEGVLISINSDSIVTITSRNRIQTIKTQD
jgi:hypothetical protein